VAAAPSTVTQETCSRMLDIAKRYRLSPAFSTAFRNVGSCIRGLQAATITRSRECSRMSFWIRSWPGSEHMNR
jgi:hypothetical protein